MFKIRKKSFYNITSNCSLRICTTPATVKSNFSAVDYTEATVEWEQWAVEDCDTVEWEQWAVEDCDTVEDNEAEGSS